MKNKAPTETPISTGVESAQREPNGSFNSIIGFSLRDLKEICSDVPLLQS